MAKSKTKKSISKDASQTEIPQVELVVATVAVEAPEQEPAKSRVRVNKQDFINRLTEKLTHFDARLVLEAAMLSAGISGDDEGYFKKDQTRDICLALIKRGGPAFSVGTRVYREVIGG